MENYGSTMKKLLTPGKISKGDIMDNPILLISILLIAILFISYVLYKYYSVDTNIKLGYTYRSKDLTGNGIVFEYDEDDFNKCIQRCERDIACDGVSYDTERQLCVGSVNGILQKSDTNYLSWKKKQGGVDDFVKKTILIGYTNKDTIVNRESIPRPSTLYNFLFSFWINIREWYDNFEYWKHIFHKGDEIDKPLNYRQWDDIVIDFPNQFIGVWLAPFTNNMRICITTLGSGKQLKNIYKHANQQICNDDKCIISDTIGGKYTHSYYEEQRKNDNEDTINSSKIRQIEYYDIKNIPVNKLFFVAIHFIERNMEVYLNGKLHKIIRLNGLPEFNDGNLYCKFDKSFNGSLHQLSYLPINTPYQRIKNIYKEKPILKTE